MRLEWRFGSETGVSENKTNQKVVPYSNLWRPSTESMIRICNNLKSEKRQTTWKLFDDRVGL